MPLFGKRHKDSDASGAAPAVDTSSLVVPGLDQHAASSGWTALGDQPLKAPFSEFVHEISLAMVRESDRVPSGPVHVTTYHSGYGGDLNGRSFAVANSFTSGWHGSQASVAQLWFPTMPLVDVTLRGWLPRPWGFKVGDAAFDDRFTVSTRDKEFAQQLLSDSMRALVLQRDDWNFMFFGYVVLCVCKEPYATVDDVRSRLAFLESLVTAVPPELAGQLASPQPTLPDGTSLDVRRPDDLKAAIMHLSPEQQADLMQKFKHVDPKERMQLIMQFLQQGGHESS